MGGCASRPKESKHDSLPDENSASYEQMPKCDGADPTIENSVEVETKNKEMPLPDTSEPKQEALNSDGECKVEQDIAITSPVPEITGSNAESGDPEKVTEAGVEAEHLRREHETSDAVSVVEMHKPDAGGEQVAPNSENLKKQNLEKPLLE